MEYLGIIIAICAAIVAIVGTMITLFLWTRSESRNDGRLLQTKIDDDLRHYDNKLESIRELVRAIHDEVKDFHNRLYNLEKSRLKDK